MQLDSNRLTFRRATLADFPTYLAMVSSAEMMHFIIGRGMTEEEARARFQLSLDAAAQHPVFGGYLIYLRDTTTCIGNFKFVLDKHDPQAAELGYMLFPAYRGQGFATEATTRMIALARTLPELRRVTAIADPNNHASTQVLTRCGFRLVRTYEEHGLPAASFEMIL
jgi:ribosomal-protein-alanine N-acetyltransferase